MKFQDKTFFSQIKLRWGLPILLLFGVLLAGCTITISPFEGLSIAHEQPTSTAETATAAVAQPPPTPWPTVGITETTPSITKALGWTLLGRSAEDVGLALHVDVDYVTGTLTLDTSFYDPAQHTGGLVRELNRHGLTPKDVRIEYALINDGINTHPLPTWTLYYLQPPAEIITPTFIIFSSPLQTGVPYSVTKMALLTEDNAASSGRCATNLDEGIACLQGIYGKPPSIALLNNSPSFLLLSTIPPRKPTHILAWFIYTPKGTLSPDNNGTLCQFCTKSCNGNWCNVVCRWVSCQ